MGAKGAGQTEATPSNAEGTCTAPTYVEKTHEELKEEIRRKKLERKLAAHTARVSPHGLEDALKHELKVLKMEKKRKRKVAKLQAHGVAIPGMVVGQSCETGAALDEGKSHKGPNKCVYMYMCVCTYVVYMCGVCVEFDCVHVYSIYVGVWLRACRSDGVLCVWCVCVWGCGHSYGFVKVMCACVCTFR